MFLLIAIIIVILKLAGSLDQSCGYSCRFQLPEEGIHLLRPLAIYAKWTEVGDELPGWYKAQVVLMDLGAL